MARAHRMERAKRTGRWIRHVLWRLVRWVGTRIWSVLVHVWNLLVHVWNELVEEAPTVLSLGGGVFLGWVVALESQPAGSVPPGFWSIWSEGSLALGLFGLILWVVRADRRGKEKARAQKPIPPLSIETLNVIAVAGEGGADEMADRVREVLLSMTGTRTEAAGGGAPPPSVVVTALSASVTTDAQGPTVAVTEVEVAPQTDQDGGRAN